MEYLYSRQARVRAPEAGAIGASLANVIKVKQERHQDMEAPATGAADYESLERLQNPPRKATGRPCRTSVNHGYLHQKIEAAEAAAKELAGDLAVLEADNERTSAELDCCVSGLEAADAHLSFLLISRCAFSRKTRALLALEEANLVRSVTTKYMAVPNRRQHAPR